MITFITGTPGAGKTLFTLERIVSDWGDAIAGKAKDNNDQLLPARPMFVCGIRDITLPGWTDISYEQVAKWWELPPGSIILVDEAQKVWPRRSPNKDIPESVKRLDTHRHQGYDFYIITQKPTNVDHDARGFVNEHYHYDRVGGLESSREFFFNRAMVNPQDWPEKDEAVHVKRRRFPKKFYNVYKSADLHTVQKKIPKKLYVYLGILALTLAGGASFAYDIMNRNQLDTTQLVDIPIGDRNPTGSQHYSHQQNSYISQWTPRIQDMPHTAPVYDQVAVVKTFPRPQCMYRHRTDECRCYTQQATPLTISRAMCMSIVEGGYFNPFVDESEQVEGGRVREGDSPPEAPPVPPEEVTSRSKTVVQVTDNSARPIRHF